MLQHRVDFSIFFFFFCSRTFDHSVKRLTLVTCLRVPATWLDLDLVSNDSKRPLDIQVKLCSHSTAQWEINKEPRRARTKKGKSRANVSFCCRLPTVLLHSRFDLFSWDAQLHVFKVWKHSERGNVSASVRTNRLYSDTGTLEAVYLKCPCIGGTGGRWPLGVRPNIISASTST